MWPEFARSFEQSQPERVLVSCANWLGLTDKDEADNLNRAKAIETVDCPVISFGLGVQARLEKEPPKLGSNTLRLAKALAERCEMLSVRDQLTKNTLEAAGIYNAVVTGCPSNFINTDPGLGKKIAARAQLKMSSTDWSQLRINISEAQGGHPRSAQVLVKTMEILEDSPAFYLIQSPDLLPFLFGENEQIPGFYKNNAFMDEPSRLSQLLRAKALHFVHMDAWLDFARTCDISFGMRLHGTVVPLQAGVPSALIAHDSRTVGLAEHMGIPWISPEDFVQSYAEEPALLLRFIADKMSGYDTRRRKLAAVMDGTIRANGLVPNEMLTRLAG